MTWGTACRAARAFRAPDRRRRTSRAFIAASAAGAAASTGFAEVPSRFQLIMSGVAASLAAWGTLSGPSPSPDESSKDEKPDTTAVV